MSSSNYRADIDGLRAVAVIGVILFHLNYEIFSGGFVGVDVFFVISGFLISKLIMDEVLENGSFSFSNFYTRRVRRILPGLFFTLFLCLIFSYVLFSPQHFERFGNSLFYSALGLSNFFFWSESGYFNTSSEFKPLLHTWSLSVEEQYYMIWPLVLVFILRRKRQYLTPVIIIVVGVISLILNLMFTSDSLNSVVVTVPLVASLISDGHAAIFYLLPFRVFEFFIGAITIWFIQFRPKKISYLKYVY